MSNKIKIKAPKDKSNKSSEQTSSGSKIAALNSGNAKFNMKNQSKKITKSFATKKK